MIARAPRSPLALLLVAIVTAAALAFAQAPAETATGSPSASASSSAGASGTAPANPPPAPSAAPAPAPRPASPPESAAPAAPAASSPYTSGLAPLPNDQSVPRRLLPPGSSDSDGPSTTIFPLQYATLRFNHRFHVTDASGPRMKCEACHKAAPGSESVNDRLTPAGATCDDCHLSDHSKLDKVTAGEEAMGKCAFCHVGYAAGDGNTVARFEIPRANMVFNHKKHLARNIQCTQCHGAVGELELATRDQMPRMRGCFSCHQMTDSAARGTARSDCLTCHVATDGTQQGSEGGAHRMRTTFASGILEPPRWLHDAQHDANWILRHKWIAGNDSQFCANCHKEDYCTDCHDGRVRPRSVHPSDYISMHPIDARQQAGQAGRCTSCHREQSFCLGCHQRLGVTMSGPADVRMSGRFHPPKEIWSDPPRKPGHHGFEAERNLNACVSCHIERDCVACHGAQGVGGGFNPHRASFLAGCATQLRRNPRPCFVCHEAGDGVLNQCR